MTVSTTNTTFAAPRHRRFGAGLARAFQSLRAGWVAHRTYNELSRLSDQQLEDIGLTRADVPRAAAGEILR